MIFSIAMDLLKRKKFSSDFAVQSITHKRVNYKNESKKEYQYKQQRIISYIKVSLCF